MEKENTSGGPYLTDFDFINVVISRQEIETGDISGPLGSLKRLLDRDAAIHFRERVDIGVSGYDADPRELYEVVEVREYVHKLDEEFPYWCYFLTKRGTGLAFVVSCFLLPFLTPEARARTWPEQIAEYLSKRGFPAMNHVCELVGLLEREVEALSNRVVDYLMVSGRVKS